MDRYDTTIFEKLLPNDKQIYGMCIQLFCDTMNLTEAINKQLFDMHKHDDTTLYVSKY